MTTQVALLTPTGRGAIASLMVEGPGALDAVAACFRPHTRAGERLKIGRIRVGVWKSPAAWTGARPAGAGEELVVCRTGPERIEVHCHGGQAAVASILADLRELGCRDVAWSELTSVGAASSLRRDAQVALAQATTERTARILLEQYHGALDHVLQQSLADLQCHKRSDARRRLADVLRYADLGLHLTTPWRVVVAGPPNVGKSSLINALVGYQRAVVFDTPGTTRDVVTVDTAFEGWPVELSDTAGIRETDDPLEILGVGRAVEQTRQADLVLWVLDATCLDRQRINDLSHEWPRALWVVNKCDLQGFLPITTSSNLLATSALTRQGLSELIDAIVQRLVPKEPPPGSALPFHPDHLERIQNVRALIDQGADDAAAAALRNWLDSGPPRPQRASL